MNKAIIFKGDLGDGTIMRLVCTNVAEVKSGNKFANLIAEIQRENAMGDKYWERDSTITYAASEAEHWAPIVLHEMTSEILKGKNYE